MIPSENSLIIGFDILPQSSPQARKSPRFSVSIVQGENIKTISSLRRGDLIRTIRQSAPSIVATDNLLELAPTEKAVIEFLSKIPSKTRVIQVTGSPIYGMTSLQKLAKRHGLQITKHPSPVETAELLAKLARLGIGTEVSAIARETRIVVSRARNIGPGGFSQSRFQRRMAGAIQQTSRTILDRLTQAGLDFDQYETRTSHGLSRCVIHVYDSFTNVSSIVHPKVNRVAGVIVRVAPVKRRSILYLSRDKKGESISPRKVLVVGVDAGITVGIAVADVTGRILALKSGRGMSRGDVIRYIVEFGKPILVATDVTPSPSFVEKLSNSLKAPLFTPQRIMTIVEKRELAKSFVTDSQIRPTNAHQRDALAAVSKAFQTYNKKLQQLKNRLREKGHLQLMNEATGLIFQGFSVSDAIEQSIKSLQSKEEEAPGKKVPTILEPSTEELGRQVKRLQRQVESLQRQVEYERVQQKKDREAKHQLTDELKTTQRQLARLLKQEQKEQRRDERIRQKTKEINRHLKQIQQLKSELDNTRRTITNLKLMRQLEIRGEVQPVLLLSQFSQEEIRRLAQQYSKRQGKVVYILNPSGGGSSTAKQLIQLGVQVILSKGTMSHLALQQFHSAQIPVIDDQGLRITIVDEFAVIDIQQLEERIINWKKQHLVNAREAAADALEQLVEEYRQDRRSGEVNKDSQ